MASGSQLPSLETLMPEAFAEFRRIAEQLERHYRDMQDVEFTIERGKLWMLQTRDGKRTAAAALKVAVDMAAEGLITREEAIGRIEPDALDQLLHPTLDPDAERTIIARGLPASPGAATGQIVFTAEEAERLKSEGEDVLLVRTETSPEDIHGMVAAVGILTARGGMTSHAAVVARGMGKPCVCGAGALKIDAKNGTMSVGGKTWRAGDVITIDGASGEVYRRPRGDAAARAHRRFRHADGLGRRGAPHAGARQRGDAERRARRARIRRGGHRPLPHRAHVLRRRAHPGRARDDPRRQFRRPARGAGEAAAHAARATSSRSSPSCAGCR